MRDDELEQMDERMQTDGMIDRATEKTDQSKTDLPHVEGEGDRSREKEGEVLAGEADVEAAEEVAEPVPTRELRRDAREETTRDEEERNEGSGLGTVAILLSVLSLLLVPFILAPAGIVLGVISGSRRSRLGWWAVGVGVFSLIVNLVAAPYMRLY